MHAAAPLHSQWVDDETTAYILENRKYFEELRQAAAQLAGWLVLAAAGAQTAVPDHPLLRAADQTCQDAADALQYAHVTPRAREHHRYLRRAAAALRIALSAAHAGIADIDPTLTPLRAAYAHLKSATNSLPGFAMVSFEQSCCALHNQVYSK
jgi:hypothetical protein